MGRVDIPLIDQEPEEKKVELPQCNWCGSKSKTICGRCKSRAYCSVECQRLDWKSGHQTACALAPVREPEKQEEEFVFYQVPYVCHWAINVRRWQIKRDSREFDFLLNRIPEEESRNRILGKKSWKAMKLALLRELVVRRMSEILTQGMWHKTNWRHDPRTGRDYLLDRTEYVWTGKKYLNSNKRFPNFNFSMVHCGEYLFVVSHPAALTGVFAAAPLQQDVLPDPREEYADAYKQALEDAAERQAAFEAEAAADGETAEEEAIAETVVDESKTPNAQSAAAPPESQTEEARDESKALDTDIAAAPLEPQEDEEVIIEEIVDTPAQAAVVTDVSGLVEDVADLTEVKPTEGNVTEESAETGADAQSASTDACLLHSYELIQVCSPEELTQRQLRLRQALVGKNAYYRTLGELKNRRWREVVLEQEPVGKETAGGDLSKEEQAARPGGPRRHHLYVEGKRQNRWRCEVHNFRGHCIVVCRGPVDEAVDPGGHFIDTVAGKHFDIDQWDKVLEHTEPSFIEVPIQQLLPEKNHTDYVRACGKGEKGEQLRMNR